MSDYTEHASDNDPEEFIKNLYRGILKREGDIEGIRSHIRDLGATPSFDKAAERLAAFVKGDEAKTIRVYRQPIGSKIGTFENIISLGTHCITSGVLQRAGLKSWSGPFDWIFSTVDMIAHCISDDFEIFLNQEHHLQIPFEEKTSKDANMASHKWYQEKFKIEFMFNHFDVTKPEVYNYYQRCVDRFREALRGGGKNLFVCISREISDRQFMSLAEAFQSYKSAHLLVIRAVKGSAIHFGADRLQVRGNHNLYELRTVEELGPVGFLSQYDEVVFKAILEGLD